MFWILIGPAIVVAYVTFKWRRSKYRSADIYDYLGPTVAFFLSGLIIGALGNGITSIVMPTKYLDTSNQLAAMNDGSGVSGDFFLGSGVLRESPSFTFYSRTGNAYTLDHVDAEYAEIIETKGKPEVVWHECVQQSFWFALVPACGYSVTFHVPPGSVKSQFVLDAK